MKIKIEHESIEVEVKDNDAVVIDDVITLVVQALLALGFHHDTIAEGIINKAEEYEISKEQENSNRLD